MKRRATDNEFFSLLDMNTEECNFNNCIINFQTGEIRERSPDDNCTLCTYSNYIARGSPGDTPEFRELQAEVVERMVAKAGSSDFSRLSVMLQARYDMELVLEVPPEAFDPAPKVNSAVVRMIPKKEFNLSQAEWIALEKLVAAAFSQRRKMLRTNLQLFSDRLEISEQELKARAQDISVDRYIEWAKVLAA
jgi:hypothetical protein